MSTIPIHLNVFHRRCDGVIVRTYSCDSEKIGFYTNERQYGSVDLAEYARWEVLDLDDFPNAIDPILPYSFDLHWDIKTVSQLKDVLKRGWVWDGTDIQEIRDMIDFYRLAGNEVIVKHFPKRSKRKKG